MIYGTHVTMWLCYALMLWVGMGAWRCRGRDDVPLILLVWWAVAELFVRLSGDLIPVGFYFLGDAAVVCILATDARRMTRAIICLYPLAWATYAVVDSHRTQWFILWGIMMMQFFLAGLQGRLGVSRNDVERLASGGWTVAWGKPSSMAAHLPVLEAHQHAAGHGEHGEVAAIERAK